MEGWRVGAWMGGGIGRLDEWAGCQSGYRRIPQDTACYPRMLQDTLILIDMFN